MKYHVEKFITLHSSDKYQVETENGYPVIILPDQSTAEYWCDLLNAQHNKTATP